MQLPAPYGDVRVLMACYAQRGVAADCAGSLPDTDGTVTVYTSVGTYPPLYYALVGWPHHLLPPEQALYAMRVLAAWLTAPLAGLAFAALRRLGTHPLLLLGGALGITPVVVFLSGGINPSGPGDRRGARAVGDHRSGGDPSGGSVRPRRRGLGGGSQRTGVGPPAGTAVRARHRRRDGRRRRAPGRARRPVDGPAAATPARAWSPCVGRRAGLDRRLWHAGCVQGDPGSRPDTGRGRRPVARP